MMRYWSNRLSVKLSKSYMLSMVFCPAKISYYIFSLQHNRISD